jgi:hypothetical protein
MLAELIASRFLPKQQGQTVGRVTGLGSVAVDQTAPAGLEMTRAGRRFRLGIKSGVTGIAPVAALPSTAAQWLLYNTDQSKACWMERLGALLVSGTAAAGLVVLVAQVKAGQLPSTVPSANATSIAPVNANQQSKIGSAVVIATAQTLAVDPGAWFPIAKSDSANTAILSVAADSGPLDGKLVLAPLSGLAICVLSGAGTTPLFTPTAEWVEVETDTE